MKTRCFVFAILATASAFGQQGGTIQGHVRLTTTTPPVNRAIPMGADPTCLTINAGKRVLQEVVLRALDGGLANGFVSLNGPFPSSAPPPTPTVIDQKGCTYHPRIQGARVGQTLLVKNSDQTLHNIHSLTKKANAFNTGQPLAGMVFKFQLKSEEVMLHLKCDVHPWMTGYIGVVTHPYYAVTDATGAFSISRVPAGKQTIKVWHERYGFLTQTVEVKNGATSTIDFTYTGTEKKPAVAEELLVPAGVTRIELVASER